jgi:hypothetical protein
MFSVRPVPRLHNKEQLRLRVIAESCSSWGRGVRYRKGMEHPLLEDTVKQRSEDRDWDHYSVYDSDL